ncbi:uncharacterized protein LOC127004662 isoform X5 [Eriocheir sinensis]|uniref:uncharacterized protein LOC127004662 isoform X5 n=1 Tax=Eriocheir sinensis TaxID=95602 RepID=UPI0021C95E39|nr:uncharacterized protein LOC127004662 isoform X5 [Eriocheir sinensis]
MRVWGSLLLLSVCLLGVPAALVVRCPTPGSNEPSYCSCTNSTMSIRCDFRNREDVILTRELLEPYDNRGIDTAYVRVMNATSVNVTGEFVDRWLEVSSAAFDIWHGGVVTLNASPRAANDTPSKFGLFAGIGIMNCIVPEVPVGFLRDRVRGAFRIKDSRVGIIRAGFIQNVKEMRYLVFNDSVVETVEGSVAAEGFVTMSQLVVHSWNGLVLSNVTIKELGPSAFNLTHKVNVTGQVLFHDNEMGAESVDALGTLSCHNASSIQNNTVLVTDPHHLAPNDATVPFHASCGKPQLFMILSPLQRVVVVEDTRAAWVLGAALAMLIMTLAMGVAWTLRRRRPVLSMSRYPFIHKGHTHTASLENLPRNIELSSPREDPEEGTSVTDLDITFDAEPDTESPQFDGDGEAKEEAAQSDSSCDAALP